MFCIGSSHKSVKPLHGQCREALRHERPPGHFGGKDPTSGQDVSAVA